jgi:hypothetical protein
MMENHRRRGCPLIKDTRHKMEADADCWLCPNEPKTPHSLAADSIPVQALPAHVESQWLSHL